MSWSFGLLKKSSMQQEYAARNQPTCSLLCTHYFKTLSFLEEQAK